MGDTKQVKVDNWGTFFLQRLKHFFNRTDYCDLTLQFQDNAQLKVHRLVLNACTEYFELLERTCEMYEDCLVMPDDLQADVVVPIVNFMYTGQLEYKYDLLDRLYQTAQIMNMSVLTKLLDAHRTQPPPPKAPVKKYRQSSNYSRPRAGPSTSHQKVYIPPPKQVSTPKVNNRYISRPPAKQYRAETVARPTRYELPEELDKDFLFESSFTDLSYESRPLMIHPQKEDKSESLSYEPSSSKKFEDLRKMMKRPSTSSSDMVEFKRLKSNQSNSIFEGEDFIQSDEGDPMFDIRLQQSSSNHSYDQIQSQGAKVTIETKTSENSQIDHAKIISEVLKKYPHLVKNNKNIKLKIVNTPAKNESKSAIRRVAAHAKRSVSPSSTLDIKPFRKEDIDRDFVYETDIVDTKEMGRLIALGVENVKGPWLCLICGTPGKALNFCSYHKFRNHLVEVHNERPPSNMCEYCGLKSGKRNHLLHHIYTKHGVPPPPSYIFPKCNQCSYIALTQAFLIKHKMTHTDVRSFNCNVCQASFKSSNLLLHHIQQTGHKICPDRKANLQCIYCMKVFLRESNLYAHLKTAHKSLARDDGIIDNSDDEDGSDDRLTIKSELIPREECAQPSHSSDEEEEDDGQYQIHQQSDGKIQIINKKVNKSPNQKILNTGLSPCSNFSKQIRKPESPKKKLPSMKTFQDIEPELTENYNERIVVLNESEYLLKGNETPIATSSVMQNEEYILSDVMDPETEEIAENSPLPEAEPTPVLAESEQPTSSLVNKKQITVNQPYQIVVSNEAEYKALMAANPSIIFQESKQLSVLGHTPDLTTANIDLDPSENSDMMIIQDNYPINVSDAISTNNPNIVVVYSHPIDPQEKQFVEYTHQQVLQEQNVQEQMLQTAELLPSMTTTAPIVEGNILMQHSVDSWQTEEQSPVVSALVEGDHNVESHVIVQDEIQQLESETHVLSSPTLVDKGLSEQAELQILSQPNITTITETFIPQPENIQQQDMEDSVIVNPIESNLNSENVQEHVDKENHNLQEKLNSENQEVQVIIPSDQAMTSKEVDDSNESNIADAVPIEGQQIMPSSNDEGEVIPIEEAVETVDESESSQEPPENEAESLIDNSGTLEVNSENIPNLASEWSDEESTPKLPEDSIDTLSNNATETANLLPTNGTTVHDASEIEESIENIQQEMENQLTTAATPKSRIIITSDITLPKSISIPPSLGVIESPSEAVEPEPVKDEESKLSVKTNISSLLNDWDDNDSQPDSNGPKTPEESVQETLKEQKPSECEVGNSDTPQKEEKLKHLDKIMSDWDDEEEKDVS